MVALINRLTGSIMMVADERVDGYLAAGHKLAAGTTKLAHADKVAEKEEAHEEPKDAEVKPAKITPAKRTAKKK